MAKSYKPAECIFAIVKNPDDLTEGWLVHVSPRSYFERHRYMYDQHLFDIPGLDELMEAVYEGPDDPQLLHDICVKAGLTWSESLTKFLGSASAEEGAEVFIPGKGAGPAVAVSFWHPDSGKVETVDCVHAISMILLDCDWINQNRPKWINWSDEEGWKRKSKRKNGGLDVRVFVHKEQAPFEVHVRATASEIQQVDFVENGATVFSATE